MARVSGGSLSSIDPKLKHLPYFEELVAHEEYAAEWRAASAGLLVLRLVDTWLEAGGLMPGEDWPTRNVESAVLEAEEGWAGRVLLSRIVATTRDHEPDIHAVLGPMMAYAQVLEYDARWALAVDVYQTVLAHLLPLEDSDASIAAHLRLAHCYRTLNQNDSAAGAYAAAGEIANRVGDLVGVLRARIGEGRISMLAGNLPQAEQIFDETIASAKAADLHEVHSRALHSRANVAHQRHQYEMAIQFAYAALEHSPNQFERDRILGDIAVAFHELGVLSAARDAYLLLSATAQDQYTRWVSTLNLLDIASQTGAETLFERYRRELRDVKLPPYLATSYALNVGLGYQRFGDIDAARRFYSTATSLAATHGFHQYSFEAEEAMQSLDRSGVSTGEIRDVSLDLEEVANAIRAMKELAGVA